MTKEEKMAIYAKLAAPFPEHCIQRTEGRVTGRGYDTAGIGYQHVVNRLNEVLGPGCFRAHRDITVKSITTPKGRTAYEAICDLVLELGEWKDGKFEAWAESLADGGHTSFSEADARKGCFTNAFKKGAAMFGVGRQAYEGTLDDDNVPAGDVVATTTEHRTVSKPSRVPEAQQRPAPLTTSSTSRLSSKQLAAIWSLAKKLELDQVGFRKAVRDRFGCNADFLSRDQASQLIGELSAKLNTNGRGGSSNGASMEAA